MTLYFSINTGAWERHLKRKHENPLFGMPAITQAEVNTAARKDEAEAIKAEQDFRALLEETIGLDAQVDSEAMVKLKARIDHLYTRCAGLKGDHTPFKQALRKLAATITGALRQAAAADPMAHAELDQEDQARQIHYDLHEFPLIADVLRPDSPIAPEDLAPTLLSESAEAVAAALMLFDPDQQVLIVNDAQALLQRLEQAGHVLPEAQARLAQMRHVLHASHQPEMIN